MSKFQGHVMDSLNLSVVCFVPWLPQNDGDGKLGRERWKLCMYALEREYHMCQPRWGLQVFAFIVRLMARLTCCRSYVRSIITGLNCFPRRKFCLKFVRALMQTNRIKLQYFDAESLKWPFHSTTRGNSYIFLWQTKWPSAMKLLKG